MGRVVKGVRVAQQTYVVKPPSTAGERAAEHAPFDDDPFFAQMQAPAEPPPLDAHALQAEAARLIDEASEDARRLIEEARERALELVADAEARAADLESAAQREGFERGVQEGRSSAQREMDDMIETMRGLIDMARIERHKIIEGAEPEIVRLAVAIAERVLHAHIAMEPAAVLEMVRGAIARVVSRETVTVRVNPADIELMREHRDRLMMMNDIDNMRLIEDQRVDRGGVIIETEAGTIDAKVSTQLREVRRLMAVEDPAPPPPSGSALLINPPAQAS